MANAVVANAVATHFNQEVTGSIPSLVRFIFALIVQLIDAIGLFHLNILV